jgi:hypothetical protein
MVESGHFVEAIERFYAQDACMQENLLPPRQGIAALLSAERKTLSSVRSARTVPGTTFLVDRDRVAINWIFEFVGLDGEVRRLDELAWQRWRGDRIVHERFYYDPGQHKAVLAKATAGL